MSITIWIWQHGVLVSLQAPRTGMDTGRVERAHLLPRESTQQAVKQPRRGSGSCPMDAHIHHWPQEMLGQVQKRLCLERQINENQMEGWLLGVGRTSTARVEMRCTLIMALTNQAVITGILPVAYNCLILLFESHQDLNSWRAVPPSPKGFTWL